MDVTSVTFNVGNAISGSPFKIPFAWCFVFEVYAVADIEGRVVAVLCFGGGAESVFIQGLLGDGECDTMCMQV